jgi:hypothetical protein
MKIRTQIYLTEREHKQLLAYRVVQAPPSVN